MDDGRHDDQIVVQLAQHERHFAKIYIDFLNSKLLTTEEKMVYIALKAYVAFGRDEGQARPSLDSLIRMTSMSKPRVIRNIDSLVAKGVLEKRRQGHCRPNMYIIYDNPAMWEAETVGAIPEVRHGLPYSSQELIAELKRRGDLPEGIKKEPKAVGAAKGSENATMSINDSNVDETESQGEISLGKLKELMDYDVLLLDQRCHQSDLDACFEIIHDVVNRRSGTIRILGDEKPVGVVKAKLMKLTYDQIEYAIKKYNSVSEPITNP